MIDFLTTARTRLLSGRLLVGRAVALSFGRGVASLLSAAWVILVARRLPLDQFGEFSVALALIIIWWPLYARYGRSLTLTTKEATFIESARASGSGRLKIMFRHLLPNVLPPILVQISLDVGTVILIFSTLAFIGFLPSNVLVPELGAIANFGLDLAPLGFWWTVVVPGGVITSFALAVNLMGDGLRDVIDPRRRS